MTAKEQDQEADKRLEETGARRAKRIEEQQEQYAREAKEAVESTSLPAWLVKWIQYKAYEDGHSAGQSEVDMLTCSMIHELEHSHSKYEKSGTTVALATNEDVINLAARIKDNWTLCELFKGTPRAGEAEYMVATTVRACKINLDREGEAFSWVDPSCHVRSGRGLADNPYAFAMLVREAYVVQEERDGKPILRMTQKLVDVLRGHLAKHS